MTTKAIQSNISYSKKMQHACGGRSEVMAYIPGIPPATKPATTVKCGEPGDQYRMWTSSSKEVRQGYVHLCIFHDNDLDTASLRATNIEGKPRYCILLLWQRLSGYKLGQTQGSISAWARPNQITPRKGKIN